MSIVDGVFTETELQSIRMRADALMFDDRIKQQYMPRVMETINAMQRVQTANITPLKTRTKDYTVEVEWFNTCEIAAEECTSCDAGGNTGSTNVETYTLNSCTQVPFTVNHDTYASNDFGVEEAIAKLSLAAEARLVEEVVADYITTLAANSGVNTWNGDPTLATIAGTETQIATADYTAAKVIPYLVKVGMFNQFTNPLMLSGNLLFNDYQLAKYQAGLLSDGGENRMFGEMQWFWDVFNFNALGLNSKQFMLSTGATAFASAPTYDTTGVENWQQEGFRWSRESRFLPGLWIDYTRKLGCRNDRLTEDWKLKARWINAVNPTGCDGTNTGILTFAKV